MKQSINDKDLATLRTAKQQLEHPGLAAKAANALGAPIERGFAMLPDHWRQTVEHATEKALRQALKVALRTMPEGETEPRDGRHSDTWHKAAAGLSGALGGAAGLLALPIELPISTTIMLRSIAHIAQSEGEDLQTVETALACLEVFAMGGSTPGNPKHSSYFATRAMLARSVGEAAKFIAQKGVAEESAPAIVRLIAAIASRFGLTVSEKAAAQAVPILGAAGGAVMNTLFLDHFQQIAHGHFAVRRLEREYGAELVRQAYEAG